MQDLSGEITLVTGASRGLGRAIAEAYARAGARVIMCARGAAALEEAAAVVRQAAREGGSAVEARVVDVRDEDGVASLVREITERWGPISVLVNNASLLGPRVPLRDYPVDVWRDVIDVNLTGPLILIRAVLPGMRAAGRGSIINVSSGTGNTARAEWGAYAVSKWALEALTNNLALEERDAGIRVNTVDPGGMRTAMRRAAYPEEDPASVPPPEAVTGVFLWLASDESRGVTGQRFRARDWTPP
ncbi:MAG TPA: SDR family oxidoreductase [Longimicrobiales bacterium]|mgnify:FL=1|nr:SDR family oxidoreductase [Longimicrobiales bacterium]